MNKKNEKEAFFDNFDHIPREIRKRIADYEGGVREYFLYSSTGACDFWVLYRVLEEKGVLMALKGVFRHCSMDEPASALRLAGEDMDDKLFRECALLHPRGALPKYVYRMDDSFVNELAERYPESIKYKEVGEKLMKETMDTCVSRSVLGMHFDHDYNVNFSLSDISYHEDFEEYVKGYSDYALKDRSILPQHLLEYCARKNPYIALDKRTSYLPDELIEELMVANGWDNLSYNIQFNLERLGFTKKINTQPKKKSWWEKLFG